MTDYFEDTLRLYQTTDDGAVFLWIYTVDDMICIDTGVLGQMAKRMQIHAKDRAKADAMITDLMSQGFAEIDENAMPFLDVVWPVKEGFADAAEFEARNAALDRLDCFCALTGLGWVDGASSGSGTMEVGLQVVDLNIAIVALQTELTKPDYPPNARLVQLAA